MNSDPMTVTSFALGKSVVVTIPKELSPRIGSKYVITKNRHQIKLVKIDGAEELIKKQKAYIEKISGSVDLGIKFTPREMNELFDEGVYEG